MECRSSNADALSIRASASLSQGKHSIYSSYYIAYLHNSVLALSTLGGYVTRNLTFTCNSQTFITNHLQAFQSYYEQNLLQDTSASNM